MDPVLSIGIISMVTSIATAAFVAFKECMPKNPRSCKSQCCGSSFDVEGDKELSDNNNNIVPHDKENGVS